jgi:hypothetical protein
MDPTKARCVPLTFGRSGALARLTEWAQSAGLNPMTFWSRVTHGWSPERLFDPIAPRFRENG